MSGVASSVVKSVARPVVPSVVVSDGAGGGGGGGPGPNDVVSNSEAVLSITEQVTSTP